MEWQEDKPTDVIRRFADVRYILLGGKPKRMQALAQQFFLEMGKLKLDHTVEEIKEVSEAGRYVMYKVGPVLTVSHGMGRPSLSILLEELAKLLYYAKMHEKELLKKPISFLRLGTCGGLGIDPGSLIVSSEAVMHHLTPQLEKYCLDKKMVFSGAFDSELREKIIDFHKKNRIESPIHIGKTMTADDFYLGQGRLDGYFKSDLNEVTRKDFFVKAHKLGIRNFEMEAAELAGFCNRPGSPLNMVAATICVALLDRMHGDQVESSPTQIQAWENGLLHFAASFVCSTLSSN